MSDRRTLMQMQAGLPVRVAVSVGVMLALIGFVYHFNLPNPNMILVIGLVLCSALYGFSGGLVAAGVMLCYTLYFFSEEHCFVRFTPTNLQKVGVTLVGVTADMLLVCLLKRAEQRAFAEVEKLTRELHRENELLQHISLTDALTGVKNKGAFAAAIDRLQAEMDAGAPPEVAIGVFDCDDLKRINDRFGHDKGDLYLKTGCQLICRVFRHSPVFRIGGDEFAVILQNDDLRDRDALVQRFEAEAEALRATKTNRWEQVSVSLGVAVFDPRLDVLVIDAVRRADKIMYADKRRRKEENPA